MTEAASEKPFETPPELTPLSDPQLLSRFVSRHDPAAFEALLRRHGPMVMGVCRRVLGDAHDAEDAFQATFLVLFRKARSISKPELLANWLYGVASHKSLKARLSAGRRRVHERPLIEAIAAPAREPDRDLYLWFDLQPLLDEELSALPDEYRAPVVLCDLEGKTIKDAADLLDCPQGTLASRLAKARDMLAQKLTRRGLVLSTATLGVLLAQNAASAAVPESSVQAMLSVAASTPAPAPWIIPFSSWLVALKPAAWTAMTATRVKLVSSIVLAFGVGTLSLAGLANVGKRAGKNVAQHVAQAVPDDGRAKAALAHIPRAAENDAWICLL